MDIILYGAGDLGRKFLEKSRDIYADEEIRVIGYGDSHKEGAFMGLPILDLSDISRYRSCRIVICIIHMEVVFEVFRKLKNIGYRDIYLYLGKDQCFSRDLWNGECEKMDIEEIGEYPLPHAELQSADWCNLNCRGCNHYSPLYDHVFPDRKKRIQDIRTLKSIFSYVGRIYLLGGEPFLNPEINLYISEIRDIYPNTTMVIMTNGLLIPKIKAETLKLIHDHHVIIQISDYDVTHKALPEIIEILSEYRIDYNIEYNSRKTEFFQPLALRTDSPYQRCNANGCYAVKDGKIARCPQLMYLSAVNKKFHVELPEEGILDLKEGLDPAWLWEELHKEVPLCRHCTAKARPWKSCGLSQVADDFIDMSI